MEEVEKRRKTRCSDTRSRCELIGTRQGRWPLVVKCNSYCIARACSHRGGHSAATQRRPSARANTRTSICTFGRSNWLRLLLAATQVINYCNFFALLFCYVLLFSKTVHSNGQRAMRSHLLLLQPKSATETNRARENVCCRAAKSNGVLCTCSALRTHNSSSVRFAPIRDMLLHLRTALRNVNKIDNCVLSFCPPPRVRRVRRTMSATVVSCVP